ncbi:C40 family peptidase [Streptomyces syringium]|uniref:C40 family peptidase n=1 Tax=Streptomyces syringium TaxID=76729 RepID=UPI003F50EE58
MVTKKLAGWSHRNINCLARKGRTGALAITLLAGMLQCSGGWEAAAMDARLVALQTARASRGAPYRWGGSGPHAFDCSGLTQYAYRKAGKRLPRTAAAQFDRTRPIQSRFRRPGDLVFFRASRKVGHVGIYAGLGRIWHAPKPGGRVRLERLWTKQVQYHRVD